MPHKSVMFDLLIFSDNSKEGEGNCDTFQEAGGQTETQTLLVVHQIHLVISNRP